MTTWIAWQGWDWNRPAKDWSKNHLVDESSRGKGNYTLCGIKIRREHYFNYKEATTPELGLDECGPCKKQAVNARCVSCGRYVPPGSPQRWIYAGYEDELLCRKCDKEINEGDTQ